MRPDGFEAQFFKLSRRATHSAFIGVLDAALDRFEQVTGHLSDPDGDIVPFIVVALGEALWCAELPAPAAEQVEDFVSEVLPELVEQVRAEAVALALPMWMRESDTADRERREVVQFMVASADGRRQTHACEVSRDAGRPPRFAMFMLACALRCPRLPCWRPLDWLSS